MKESFADKRGRILHEQIFVIASTVGVAATSGLMGVGVGNLVRHSKEDSHELVRHSKEDSHENKSPTRNKLQRDLPSIVMDIGEYTPIATEPQHYITVEENLPGPGNVPGSGQHVDVTLNIPADKAARYHKGQELTPQQTNEMIDSQ